MKIKYICHLINIRFFYLLVLLLLISSCSNYSWPKIKAIPNIPTNPSIEIIPNELIDNVSIIKKCTETFESLDLPECN